MTEIPKLTLDRTEDDTVSTYGHIKMPSGITYQTLERPWKNNEKGISCIPPGTYLCKLTMSKRFGVPLYLVTGVPGRDGIRIHAANWSKQLEGCIALGVSRMVGGVAASKIAVGRFMNELNGSDFMLEVKGP